MRDFVFGWLMLLLIATSAATSIADVPTPTAGQNASPDARRVAKRDQLVAEALQLYTDGKVAQAAEAYQEIRILERQTFGADDINLLDTVIDLESLYGELGDSNRAIQMARERHRLCVISYGESSWQTRQARWGMDYHLKLANAAIDLKTQMRKLETKYQQLIRQGQFKDAAECNQRLADIEIQVLGPEHPNLAQSYLNIAEAYNNVGEFSNAETNVRRAGKMFLAAIGESSPHIAKSSFVLGQSLWGQKRYRDADKALQVAERVYTESSDVDGSAAATSFRGGCARDQGDDSTAIKFYAKAVELLKDKPLNGYFAPSANECGQALYRLEKYADACPYFIMAAEAYLTTEQKLNAAYSNAYLGDSYHEIGMNAEAAIAYQKAVLGLAEHKRYKHLAWTAEKLATAFLNLKRFADSAASSRTAAAAYAKLHGDQYWEVRSNLELAHLSQRMSELSAADSSKLERADLLTEEGKTLSEQGKWNEAIAAATEALSIREGLLGDDFAVTADSYELLGKLRIRTEEFDEALTLVTKAWNSKARVYGAEHPYSAGTEGSLGTVYLKLGEISKGFALAGHAMTVLLSCKDPKHGAEVAADFAAIGEVFDGKRRIEDIVSTLERIESHIHNFYSSDSALGFDTAVAQFYYANGEYSRARDKLESVVADRRRSLGSSHGDTAKSINALADVYSALGDLEKAESLYQEALAICVKAYGESHTQVADTLEDLATLYNQMSDTERAEAFYEQALRIRLKVLPKTHFSIGVNLVQLGGTYRSRGEYERARTCFVQAWKILQTLGPEGLFARQAYYQLGRLYHNEDDFVRAETHFLKAVNIERSTLGDENPITLGTMNNLGILYHDIGQYDRAERFLQGTLDLRRRTLGEIHESTARSVSNLGWLYYDQGKFDQALDLYRTSLTTMRTILDRAALAQSERQQLLMQDAERSYLDAYLTLALRQNTDAEEVWSQVLTWKGAIFARQRALRTYSDSPELFAKFTALQCATTAFSMLSRSAPSDAAKITEWKAGLSQLRDKKERLEIEINRLQSHEDRSPLTAQQVRDVIPDNTVLVDYFTFVKSTSRHLDVRAGIGTSLVVRDDKLLVAKVLGNGAAARSGQLEVDDHITAVAEVGGDFVMTKGKSLSEVISLIVGSSGTVVRLELMRKNHEQPILCSITREVIPYQRKVEWTKEPTLAAFVLSKTGPIRLVDLGPVAPLSKAVDTWRTTFGMSEDAREAGQLLRERIWLPIYEDVNPYKTVLVSTDGFLGRLPLVALPGKNPGTYLLEDHRVSILPVPQMLPELIRRDDRAAAERALLLVGAVNYDSAANELKPAATGDSGGPGWKLASRTRSVRGGSHFTELPQTGPEIAEIKRTFSSVFYGDDLDSAQREALERDTKLLSGAAATETRLRELASQYYYLHLATHGFFASADKKSALSITDGQGRGLFAGHEEEIRGFSPNLLSGIALAGANEHVVPRDAQSTATVAQDDGILTAEEVASMPLGAELVVLSACETGLGEVAAGEGLLGLQRAFQVAGARTTVASYWYVNDLATQQLMIHFYRNLWQRKASRLDALRDAQLHLLNHPEEVRGATPEPRSSAARTSPLYWAAFTLSGDWR